MAAAFLLAPGALAQGAPPPPEDRFEARTHQNDRGERMPYRLYLPAGYDPLRKYPLLLWLHGSKGRGKDNKRQLRGANAWAAVEFSSEETQAKFPHVIVAPQCPLKRTWDRSGGLEASREQRLVLEILAALRQQYSIDPQRIYVAGESMGGFGAWSFAVKWPELFAAAVPLCGGGNPEFVARIREVPVWAFHGAADRTVPVRRSRQMVDALRKAGGDPRYSEYPKVKHDVWKQAFTEPRLLPWIFSQSKGPAPAGNSPAPAHQERLSVAPPHRR